jgi:hypothetical protein
METDEMNFMILQSAASALKEKGKFIFTTLNGFFPLFHSVKDFINSAMSGHNKSLDNSFDLMTFRDVSAFEFVDDDGHSRSLQCNERYYVPSEISWLLKWLHFKIIDIYGCQIGAFSRNHSLTTEDFEMLVIGQK